MAGKLRKAYDFTNGPLIGPMIKFTLPILGALILQSLYGAVDLWVVGQYGVTADISAVATGSRMIHTITNVIIGLAVGTSVLIGQHMGAGRKDKAGDILAAGIKLFTVCAIVFTVAVPLLSPAIAGALNSPAEAFPRTVSYMRICSYGAIFIVAYNLLSSLFKGMGDSSTPLMAVAIAAVLNVFGDIAFVKGLGMGASGAALATVIAQAISVVICILVIKKRGLPFEFSLANLKAKQWPNIVKTVKLGAPITLQSILVNISFLFITAIVNDLGLVQSSGMGVAEKLCVFIMMLPIAFSQSLSTMVAQNIGAARQDRADKSMLIGMGLSFSMSLIIGYLAFFHGDLLCRIFSNEPEVIAAGWEYLKAYAVDCLLTPFLFCFIGYFNGCGFTFFTMLQGVVGAFCVRIPVSMLMKSIQPVSLFRIGLATPASSLLQIILCTIVLIIKKKKRNAQQPDITA